MRTGAVTRRTLVTGSLAALVAGCGSPTTEDGRPTADRATGTPRPARHRYGGAQSQFGDLYLPDSGPARGTIVVIHGGFWSDDYGLELGDATSTDLTERGWAAWNIEYRRLGSSGGWPATFEDVAAAVDHLAALPGVDLDRVVTLGHSAGGHLAAWAATRDRATPGGEPRVRVTAAVPLSGVLDLATAARQGLGGGAVPALVGGSPARVAERYALASPLRRLPLGVPLRCVHARDDTVVPRSQSAAFVDAARAAGDDAELVEVPGAHLDLIDPASPAWPRVVDVLEALP